MQNQDKPHPDAERWAELDKAMRAVERQARALNQLHPMQLAHFVVNGKTVIGFREIAK